MNNQNNKNIKNNINLEMDNNSDDDIREPDKIIVEKLIYQKSIYLKGKQNCQRIS